MEGLLALLILTSIVLLVIGLFSPEKSLFWDKKNHPTKKRSATIYGITFIVSCVILGIISDNNRSKPNSKTTQEIADAGKDMVTPVEEPVEKKWVTVHTFKGNGMKKSPVFALTGGKARLKYSYKAPSGIGTGLFSVYVVDEGKDIMRTGGFPEVMSNAEREESESSLQKRKGRYYLNVNASGKWVVMVQELK